jgi:hypothetical protein
MAGINPSVFLKNLCSLFSFLEEKDKMEYDLKVVLKLNSKLFQHSISIF